VIMFGGNFVPQGWALCDGSLRSIDNDSALFAILGTTYGGDGVNTFALPDLRGRVPTGVGNGPGLNPMVQGEMAGSNNTTLTVTNLPAHNHVATLVAEGAAGNTANPTDAMLSVSTAGDKIYGPDTVATEVNMNAKSVQVQPTGGNTPVSNMQAYLGMSYIIATEGIFPSRN
jgi:microcystin-dependent protein